MMDGWASAGVTGILYAEDFSEPPPPPTTTPEPAWAPEPPPPPPPGLTQAEVDAACIRAVRAAETAWSDSAGERRTLALEALAAGLSAARQAASVEAEAMAEGLAHTVLGMVAALLPELARRHGDAEVRALLRRLLPVVGRTPGVVVRAHAGVLDQVAADLAALDDGLADTVQLRPANLPPGDVRITWAEGGLARDTVAIQAAVQDCLAQLGLLAPTPVADPVTAPTTEARSLAHAH